MTTATATATATANDDLRAFIEGCIAFQSNSVRLAALKEEQMGLVSANGELRKKIIPYFKKNEDKPWGTIKGPIKMMIAEVKAKDPNGLLGVLKTCFEYQIMPTQANADRLRKAEAWTNWNGTVGRNRYKPVHAKEAPAPAPAEGQTVEAALAALTTQTTATAPAPAVQPKPPVKGTPEGLQRPNVIGEPPLSVNQLWAQTVTQLVNYKLTLAFFESFEKENNLPKGALLKGFVEARRLALEVK